MQRWRAKPKIRMATTALAPVQRASSSEKIVAWAGISCSKPAVQSSATK